MQVSRKWIDWAHTPPAESGIEPSARLCEMAAQPGRGNIEVDDVELIQELVSVAECYGQPASGDSLYEMGPWWRGQPKKVIAAGRAALRARQSRAAHAHP